MKNFDDFVGVEMLEVKGNEGFARVKLKEESLNSIKTVHGGLIMTLADTVSGNLIAKATGRVGTTAQASLNFLSPCFGGEYLYAKAKIIKEGKSLSSVDTEITDDNGKLIARSTFVFFHLNKEINLQNN